MDYIRAGLIRGTSLSGLIGERYSAGQGFGRAFGGALSDTLKAKAIGIKEKVDPLNIVRQLTGRGALGNIATAVAGRALGRSQRDIAYFGGYVRRRSTIPSLEKPEGTATRAAPGRQNSEMLEKIYQYMKKSSDERRRTEQLSRAFRQEQLNEDERRHQQLLKAIRESSGVVIAEKPQEDKTGGLLDIIRSMISAAIDKFSAAFDWLKNLKDPIVGFFKLFTTKTLSMFTKLIPLLGSPMFLVAAAGAATIYGLTQLLTKLSEITPDFKQLSPAEARAALENEQEIVKQAQARYNKKDVTKEQILETKTYLEDRVLRGRQEAERISKIEDEEERKKAIREFGGEALLKKTLEDKTVYTLPTASETEKLPDVVRPRPTKRGSEQLALAWDRQFAQTHDPVTGLRKDLLQSDAETARLLRQSGVTPTVQSTSTATSSVSKSYSSDKLQTNTVENDSQSSSSSSVLTKENESQAETSRLLRSVPPIPVERVAPDITPVPETTPVSMMMQEPFIQTNTNTNVIGGSKDKVLATNTPKQRNTDLNRFLSNSSVVV